ncbi:uncharacterized protein SETTUDRAFT_178397 [Exserohilum turcica Et28A]|uniref:Transcription factor domain-containing protein n=1 Tax=Exserohilum turcicum (strain 28A) TaxID=671987 RepID=R0J5W5_EXST2|nr:uncharacterized protein SETTUDRAFT_178397 [Exserohilum turcica Et28A]EOA92091.1 hypothetical protein SETTUDRAFT_178397 [Exserohilum turcica Et28A]
MLDEDGSFAAAETVPSLHTTDNVIDTLYHDHGSGSGDGNGPGNVDGNGHGHDLQAFDIAQHAHSDADTLSNDGAWIAATALCRVYSHDEQSSGLNSGGPQEAVSMYAAGPLGRVDGRSMSTSSSSNSTSALQPVDHLSALGLDMSTAYSILDHLFLQAAKHGPLSILNDLHLNATIATQCFLDKAHPRCPVELTLSLLAIALELYPDLLPRNIYENKDIIIDTLRIEFLKRIPTLTWKTTDINHSQSLALSLASYAWCLNSQLSAIAAQWNGVAQLLLNALAAPSHPETARLHTHLGQMIQHQNIVLRLVNGRGFAAMEFSAPVTPLPSQLAHTPTDVPTSDDFFPHSTSSFANLFLPLSPLLDRVCKLPSQEATDAASKIRLHLEDYYLAFPTKALQFSSLTYTFQAEAMIWLHGIFMISYVGSDPMHILTNVDLVNHSTFYSAFEHALLLGEVLPTIMSLDKELTTLSPATAHMMILSSAISAVAMWLFHTPWGEKNMNTSMAERMPATLTTCAESHRCALESLQRTSGRYRSEILDLVHKCLLVLAEGMTLATWTSLQTATQTLMSQGSGALHGIHSGPILPLLDASNNVHCRDALNTLCDPAARACQPGYFDLNIQF